MSQQNNEPHQQVKRVRLDARLVTTLRKLADQENLPISVMIAQLVGEAVVRRLQEARR